MRAPSALAVLPVEADMPTRASRVFRIGEGGNLWARDVQMIRGADGVPYSSFCLCEGNKNVEITLPVIGDIAVENALFTAALCRAAGLSREQIAKAFPHVWVRGRMECLSAKHARLVYLDAAFGPEDLATALGTLRPLARGRLCVLLGSVGGRARERRVPLGRTACALADFVYLTADDPDGEDPVQICQEIMAGMSEPTRAVILPDRRTAILRAVRELREGDVLLILAKSADKGQLVGGCYHPFDDRAEVKASFSLA